MKTSLGKIYDIFDNHLSIGKAKAASLDEQDTVDESAVAYIKANILRGILDTHEEISPLLGDLVEMIARDSFDLNWPELIPGCAEALKTEDPIAALRIFRTLSPIFKKI